MKPHRVSLALGLALGLSILCLFAAGCATPQTAQASRLDVTYYYRPGCAVCAHALPQVAGLDREFPGQLKIRTVDATSPDGVRAIQRLDLEGHGIVIRSDRGYVLWKQPLHDVNMDEVRSELRLLLANQQAKL